MPYKDIEMKRESGRRYKRTANGVINTIWHNQLASCKKRNMPTPTYSKEWFYQWLMSHERFNEMYQDWAGSGYKSELKPSVDRLNDCLSYTKDNIQLITWGENDTKGREAKREGKNNKQVRTVNQLTKDGSLVATFASFSIAQRKTGILQTSIGRCCRRVGSFKSAGGFRWEYA